MLAWLAVPSCRSSLRCLCHRVGAVTEVTTLSARSCRKLLRTPADLPGLAAALTPPATRATARDRRGEELSECPEASGQLCPSTDRGEMAEAGVSLPYRHHTDNRTD